MSRLRDAINPKRALLGHKEPVAGHSSAAQGAGALGKAGQSSAGRNDEKTPLLNSMGAAAESLVNNSVVGGDMQTGVSWGMAAFLLVNTALGAGMLNYPYAYEQIGGVWPAALMQVVSFVRPSSSINFHLRIGATPWAPASRSAIIGVVLCTGAERRPLATTMAT